MNYIVMDLEWNQSAKGKQFSEDHFPFEIIQIGAALVTISSSARITAL